MCRQVANVEATFSMSSISPFPLSDILLVANPLARCSSSASIISEVKYLV
jgi:hypothetical protein